MKKWLLRLVYGFLALAPIAAFADYTATQGSGSTVFAFVCSTTKICPAMVLIDSTNVEKATAGNPLRIDPTGTTTQPVSAASLPLPTGAATSANQTTGNTSLGTIATNTPALVSNASSAVATGSSNQPAVAYLYGFNGTTYDQLQVDGSKNLKVSVQNANANGASTMANSSPVSVGGGNSSAAISISTATTTQLVALSGSTKIYVMAWDVIAAGTGNITLEYGTGTACATGTTVLTGAYNLTAQAGISKGDGSAPVLIVPAGNALCALTSAAVQMSGSVTYQQF